MCNSSMTGECRCATDAIPSRNLELVQGASDSSRTLREGHHVIFNIHRLMSVDGTLSLKSI